MNRKTIYTTYISTWEMEDYKEQNYIDEETIPSDEEVYEILSYVNNEDREMLKEEFHKIGEQISGDIIAIADLGLWNGHRSGYRILESLDECLDFFGRDTMDMEVYLEGNDLVIVEFHHDGRNTYRIREVRKQNNKMLYNIYTNDAKMEESIKRNTRGLAKLINDNIWKF